jgi:predicted transcriptional regulator
MASVLDDPQRMGAMVREFIEPPLPLIDGARTTREVLQILGGKDAAVLVEEHGRIAGILTRYDLVDFVQKGN